MDEERKELKESKEPSRDLDDIELKVLDNMKRYAGDWAENATDLLESWLEKCRAQASTHVKAAKNKRFKYRSLSVPTIVCASASTALSFYLSGADCSGDVNAIQILSSCLVAATTILSSVNALYGFLGTKAQHIATSGRFTILAMQIQLQLHLPINRKADIEVLLTSITDQYADIVNSAPLV